LRERFQQLSGLLEGVAGSFLEYTQVQHEIRAFKQLVQFDRFGGQAGRHGGDKDAQHQYAVPNYRHSPVNLHNHFVLKNWPTS
jgi:hypothetical protein